jgi:hypothetical protein
MCSMQQEYDDVGNRTFLGGIFAISEIRIATSKPWVDHEDVS